jgi:cell division protein FtsQ
MKAGKVVGIVVIVLLLTGAVSYAVYSLLTFSSVEKEIKCSDLEISIRTTLPLLTGDEIHQMLRAEGLHPIGVSVPVLRTEAIERFLSGHPYVKKVSCYHDPGGRVFLKLELRTPRFMVMGNENYYIDDEGQRIPTRPGVMAYVPVVTGRVTRTIIQGELYELIDFIAGDEFWNAQIQQIHVRDDLKIELVPRVGETLILLGPTEGFRLKLDRLMRLYRQAFNVVGWNSYQLLDLRFENQIVAVKN